jgi:ribonucleotide monophosphatase NagD (HAD superfamily)
MVGDDLDADIRGAKSAGLVAVAVQTGKYRPDDAEVTRQAADVVLGSIAELPRWLGVAP